MTISKMFGTAVGCKMFCTVYITVKYAGNR